MGEEVDEVQYWNAETEKLFLKISLWFVVEK